MSAFHDRLDTLFTQGTTLLHSFGGSSSSLSTLEQPTDDQSWQRLFAEAGPGGVTVRGAGASYSDAALNEGGAVAVTTDQPRIRGWARGTGMLDVDAGVTLEEALVFCTPRGWSFPVVPGTAHLTLGGALAADVHGKNHPSAGSFSACVEQIVLITPAQGVLTVGPTQQPEIFWATAGGLGLTGAITRLRLQLTRIRTNWMLTSDTACVDLDDVIATMTERAEQYEYVVGWVDGHATHGSFGRGIVSAADHLDIADLPATLRGTPLMYRPSSRQLRIPTMGNLMQPALMQVANAFRFSRAKHHTGGQISDYSHTFHPLDSVADWPALYGRRGLVQYQFAIPPEQEQVLHTALRELRVADCPPSLVTLKRLGDASMGHLSFPCSGWTMALDFPAVAAANASTLLRRLDLAVCATGGRVYLVKNHRTHPDLMSQMYPRLDQWRVVRDRLDPDGVLTSDLNRRLNLTGHHESVQP